MNNKEWREHMERSLREADIPPRNVKSPNGPRDLEIFTRYVRGETAQAIGKRFGIVKQRVYQIVNRETRRRDDWISRKHDRR